MFWLFGWTLAFAAPDPAPIFISDTREEITIDGAPK